jgi:NADH-quinone oxidoreductase subunit D
MFPSYQRIGGLREDLPRGFHEAVNAFLDAFPGKIDEYERLLTKNVIFRRRTDGIGRLSKDDTLALGLVGPLTRAVGVAYDVRRAFPYLHYDRVEFEVPTRTAGDVYARYLVRLAEMRESVRICRQAMEHITPSGPWAIDDPRITPPAKDKVYTEMEALIQHFLVYSQGFTVPVGEACVPIEGPRGEQGFYVVSDGTNRPWRVKARSPSLLAVQAIPRMCVGGLIADVVAIIGSTDIVLGDVDR